MNILETLPKPFFVLAPMDEVTETVFRRIIESTAPADLYFTEFVNVDGLQSPGRPNLLKKLRMTEGEGPLVAQLWGLKPENFEKTAQEIASGDLAREICQAYGHDELVQDNPQHVCSQFVGIDLNMGCPAKSEVQNGACSALIKNRPLASEIIKATKKGVANAGAAIPVSVKTRLGFNEIDFSWHEFLLGHDISMLTVHFRTRKQMSKVPAEWQHAAEIVRLRDATAPTTKIVGNGDVMNREMGEAYAAQYGLDGIMIGRGVFHDPFVFAKKSLWTDYTKEQKISLLKRHIELFNTTWTGNERRYETLKKFAKVYIHEFDGAKELRETIMSTFSAEEALIILNKQ